MELKIIETSEEPLLSRKKIISEIQFTGSIPSNNEVRSKIAASINGSEKLILIKKIHTKFGFKKADVTAYLYETEEDKNFFDKKKIKKEDENKEEKKK